MLAGIPVDDNLVLELARRLRDAGLDAAAETLEDAYDGERRVVALTVPDREAIRARARGLPGRAGRAARVLLREHEWRRREGL